MAATYQAPKSTTYDVIFVGGAMMAASASWFLSRDKDFDGRVLVVEKDPSEVGKVATGTLRLMVDGQLTASWGYAF